MDKINWINGQAGGTPLSAENLNLMEDNIEDAIDAVQTELIGKTLFDNSSGTTGNVTLSESIANMKRLRIKGYQVTSSIKYNFSQDIDVTFDGKVSLMFKGHVGSQYNYIVSEVFELSSTAITRGTQQQIGLGASSIIFNDASIYITKVVGFNY